MNGIIEIIKLLFDNSNVWLNYSNFGMLIGFAVLAIWYINLYLFEKRSIADIEASLKEFSDYVRNPDRKITDLKKIISKSTFLKGLEKKVITKQKMNQIFSTDDLIDEFNKKVFENDSIIKTILGSFTAIGLLFTFLGLTFGIFHSAQILKKAGGMEYKKPQQYKSQKLEDADKGKTKNNEKHKNSIENNKSKENKAKNNKVKNKSDNKVNDEKENDQIIRDEEKIIGKLVDPINDMALAFVSSLIGLSLSLIFSMLNSMNKQGIIKRIDKLVELLEYDFVPNYAPSVTEMHFENSFKRLSEEMEFMFAEFHKNFLKEFSEFSNVITNKLADVQDNNLESLRSLEKRFENLLSSNMETTNDMNTSLINSVKSVFNNMMLTQSDIMRKYFADTKVYFDEFATKNANMLEKFEDNIENNLNSVDNVISQMVSLKNELIKLMESSFSMMIEKNQNIWESYVQETYNFYDSSTKKLVNTMNSLVNEITTLSGSFSDTRNAIEHQNDIIDIMSEKIEKSSDIMVTSSKLFNEHIDNFTRLSEPLIGVREAFTKFLDELDPFIDAMNRYVAERKEITILGNINNKLSNVIDELISFRNMAETVNSVGNFLAQFNENILVQNKNIENAINKMRKDLANMSIDANVNVDSFKEFKYHLETIVKLLEKSRQNWLLRIFSKKRG